MGSSQAELEPYLDSVQPKPIHKNLWSTRPDPTRPETLSARPNSTRNKTPARAITNVEAEEWGERRLRLMAEKEGRERKEWKVGGRGGKQIKL